MEGDKKGDWWRILDYLHRMTAVGQSSADG